MDTSELKERHDRAKAIVKALDRLMSLVQKRDRIQRLLDDDQSKNSLLVRDENQKVVTTINHPEAIRKYLSDYVEVLNNAIRNNQAQSELDPEGVDNP